MEGHLQCLKFTVGESRTSAHVLQARNNTGDTPKLLATQFFKQAVVDYINNIEWEMEHPGEAQNLSFPAHVSAFEGDLTHLRMLVENQIVNINEKDDKGATPAHKAAGQGHTDIIQWLVEMGADMTITNQAGETPRDIARRFGRLAIVRLLGPSPSEDENMRSSSDRPKMKKKKDKKKKSKRKKERRRVEVVIGSDGEEKEIECVEMITDSSSSSSSSSSDDDEWNSPQNIESKERAKKQMEKLEMQLEVATKNYMQFGGTVDEKDSKRFRDDREQRRMETLTARKLAEAEAMLEGERHRREKLEARVDQYKVELSHIAAQNRSKSAHGDDDRSKPQRRPVVKNRSSSKEPASSVHRKGNFKIV